MAYGDSFYTVTVEANGDIFEISGYQKGRKLGIDIRKEAQLIEELQEKTQDIAERDEILENWRQILIENGLIKIPKTPEELAQEIAAEQIRITQEQAREQAEINKALLEAIGSLKTEIGELKHEHTENIGNVDVKRIDSKVTTGQSAKKPTTTIKGNGAKPTTNKVGTGAGSKDTPKRI